MDDKIIEECRKLVAGFQPCGPMTVQLIRESVTGDDYYIEINPRFGGGAPLSMKAGSRSAEMILKMLLGEKTKYIDEISDGAVYSRFDQSVCTTKGKRELPVLGVIFDLDDTLYSEKEYVRSGYKAVAKVLGNDSFAGELWENFENGMPAIDALLDKYNCAEKKEECLKAYREQRPEITLYKGVVDLISELLVNGIKVGIITDGRVSGQKKKIQALGLDQMVKDIIITDEIGGIQFRKPCDIAFRIMQHKWGIPFEQIVYVGDNTLKDFQAPKQLGMQSVYFKNRDGLYLHDMSEGYNIIENILEIKKMI